MPHAFARTLAALAALVPLASAAQAMPMGGLFTGRVDGRTLTPIAPNKVRIVQTASGTNSGSGTPFDGAQVRWSDTVLLMNGQGTHQGTLTITTPQGTTTSPYRGQVSTDAQGRVTASGTFRTIKGTGTFVGLTGGGSYNVAYSSRDDFTSNWQGQFKPRSPAMARR